MRNILDQVGNLEIDEVDGGKKCLEFYKALYANGHVYNVIFMDLIMPILDGYATTQSIRKWEATETNLPTFICGISNDA